MAHFTRTHPAPSITGDYTAFRPYVRDDFRECCAYCLMHERWAAGAEGFQLDHFRPCKLFPELERDFLNLYYACYPCNKKKHDKWPSRELQGQAIGFVDLCRDEFSDHFEECPDGSWRPLTPSAGYTMDSLRLNSEHLKELRCILARLRSEGVL